MHEPLCLQVNKLKCCEDLVLQGQHKHKGRSSWLLQLKSKIVTVFDVKLELRQCTYLARVPLSPVRSSEGVRTRFFEDATLRKLTVIWPALALRRLQA